MRPVIRFVSIGLLLFGGFSACGGSGGGGGGGGQPPINQAPVLSNLQLSQTTFDRDTSGRLGIIIATVEYSDPEADINEIRLQVENEPLISIPVEGALPSTGQLIGEINFSLAESGVFLVEVWAVDASGNSSNRLTATITIVGDTELTDLAISAASFDQQFRDFFFGDYTAVVNVVVDSTTVTGYRRRPQFEYRRQWRDDCVRRHHGPDSAGHGPLNAIDVVVTTIDGSKTDTYTIRVLRNALDLTQSTYIKASNTDFDDRFSESLVLDGDTLIVTSRLEDSVSSGVNGDQSDNSASNAGAAYVLTRAAGGGWVQQAYLKASNAEANDFFGSAAALDDDTLAIGAVWERSSATGVDGDQADKLRTRCRCGLRVFT